MIAETAAPLPHWRGRLTGSALALLVAAGVFAAIGPGLRVWQQPGRWADVLTLSPAGAAATLLLVVAALVVGFRRGRQPLPRLIIAAGLTPLAFNLLMTTRSVELMAGLMTPFGLTGEVAAAAGRCLVLAGWGLAVVIGLGWLIDRRIGREPGILVVVPLTAMAAGLSPFVAGRASLAAALPVLAPVIAALMAAAALAGLWALVHLATGALIDALHRRRPTGARMAHHAMSGARKGAMFGLVFMGLTQAAAHGLAAAGPLVAAAPVPVAALIGALLFPLVIALVETFDGSPPLRGRVAARYADPAGYARGLVAGGGIGWALAAGLPQADWSLRFAAGALIGAAAFAGVDVARDLAAIARGARRRLPPARVHVLAALIGASAGGALAWYFDAGQLAVVTAKLGDYAMLSRAAAGQPVGDYVVFPFFSKWGEIRLGPVTGAVGLLYAESLSGVINWSIAAPLFAINLVALTALFERSLAPVRGLFSREGAVAMVEQTVRVLRWGPWMAPIIYSFLRLSPDPTWYNQDGAVRTLVATAASLSLPEAGFRAFSLELFLGLLAFDWLRVMIWADHFALRVSTLVNLSFVGGDRLDRAAARWLGHAVPTAVIPEAWRRFTTWAPLTIPFYLPRGAEWDAVWTGAERATHASPLILPAVAVMAGIYAAAGTLALVGLALVGRRMAHLPPPLVGPMHGAAMIGNGHITAVLAPDGHGYLRLERDAVPLDLTWRPAERLAREGLALFIHEGTGEARRFGAAPQAVSCHATRLAVVEDWPGLSGRLEIEVADGAPLVTSRLSLRATDGRARRLVLVTHRRPTLAEAHASWRSPAFNALHLTSRFDAASAGLLFEGRGGSGYLHALVPGPGARLMGYQDVGWEGAGHGEAPGSEPARLPGDEGWLVPVDPVARLWIEVEVPADGEAVVSWRDGFAPDAGAVDGSRPRRHRPMPPGRHAFDDEAACLRFAGHPPRPWHHVIANPLGFGAIADDRGRVGCFARNAQHHAITPSAMPVGVPEPGGQCLGVTAVDGAVVHGPGTLPDETAFGLGWVGYTRRGQGITVRRTVTVPFDRAAQVSLIEIENAGERPVRLDLVWQARLVLGEIGADTAGQLIVERAGGVLAARHPQPAFVGGTVAVASSLGPPGDPIRRPAPEDGDDGVRTAQFEGVRELAPGAVERFAVAIAHADDASEACRVARELADPDRARALPAATEAAWRERLGMLRLVTDDPAFDRLVNVWLPHQVLAARLWGRTGPCQRGGAFGYRDQLQDVMPLSWIAPEIARRQILMHAARHFVEGDPVHWWHAAPDGRTGLAARNLVSDLPLWLPWVAAAHVRATGDAALFDERVTLMDGLAVPRGRPGIVEVPRPSRDEADLWSLCLNGVDLVLGRTGPNGLPLMLHGDWNDGMNALGRRGRGESVWLGLFLRAVIADLIPLAARRGDAATAARLAAALGPLDAALARCREGGRFARAIADDGTRLVMAGALTAAWPVLSGLVTGRDGLELIRGALRDLETPDHVRLLHPAFDAGSRPFPGRIADHPPGVRENGGQYSHGVSWLVDALMRIHREADAAGDGGTAHEARADAVRLWRKISPLGRGGAGPDWPTDGLPPHQQPADIMDGAGHDGLGGWTWYTGAAARMLCAAWSLHGLDLRDGRLTVAGNPAAMRDGPRLRAVIWRGETVWRDPAG